jgi:GMC oxidoreductase/Domain of unknown function (DUF1772)
LSTPDGTLIETLASPEEVGDEICLIRGTVPPEVAVPLEVMPGNLKGAELENFVRYGVVSYWHQTCTAKMGRDSMSLVDSRLRVHGIDNLRIADGVALAVMYGVHSIPGQLAAAGAACYALVIIIGLPTCVRINHQIARWSIQNPPSEWAQTRARWLRFHVIRTLCSVPAFVVYVLAAMSSIRR